MALQVFKTKYKLSRHYATVHLRRKDYICEICGKGFGEKGNLALHMRTVHEQDRCGERLSVPT
eukprot:SAG31_NODE_3033_length_4764_cov_1.641372_4_plen_63_part_00